jgi:hypothetical protein
MTYRSGQVRVAQHGYPLIRGLKAHEVRNLTLTILRLSRPAGR